MMLEENLPYNEAPRAFGHGDLRLGDTLELGSNIFSLGLLCEVKNELIRKYFNPNNIHSCI